MVMLTRTACFLCLAESLVYKFDRLSRPYASCSSCGSRVFFHSREALSGPAAFASFVAKVGIAKARELVAAMGGDPVSLVASASQYVPARAPSPSPVPVA